MCTLTGHFIRYTSTIQVGSNTTTLPETFTKLMRFQFLLTVREILMLVCAVVVQECVFLMYAKEENAKY